MQHLRLYFHACLILIFTVVIVGFLCPWMISADDDFSPVIGVLLLLAVPPVVVMFLWHAFKTLRGIANEENDKDARVRRPTRPR